MSKSAQQKIADLVIKSHEARKKAKELLEEAKRKVEEMIEKKLNSKIASDFAGFSAEIWRFAILVSLW